MGRTSLQEGTDDGQMTSWRGVPHGCSVQSHGDWAAHFHSATAGTTSANNGGYTPVCQLIQYDAAIECEPSDRQRGALFAPLDFEVPVVTTRKWRPTRGELRNAAASYP